MPTDPPRNPQHMNGSPTLRRSVGAARPGPRTSSSHRRLRIADVRRIRRHVLLGLYTILAGEVIAAALTTPLLHIKRIQVHGTDGLTQTEIAATNSAVKLPYGTNFLLAPLVRTQTRVRALPWVESATVRRQFPNIFILEMTSRESAAQVQTANGGYEVDGSGTPIRLLRQDMAARLPRIDWKQLDRVNPGTPFGDHALQSALKLTQWAQKDSAVRVSKIEVDQSDNICLNMGDGIQIKLGSDDELETKQTLVSALYRREPDIARRVREIDISSPSDIACLPRVVLPIPASIAPEGDVTASIKP